MKKIAVEWLMDKYRTQNGIIAAADYHTAKEIEKQQIIKAAGSAYEDMFGTDGIEYGQKYYEKLTQKS